jgi:phenylpropionate dioxygenase-like ring-hydroxylating dioxygenase large terminal subunit
MMQTPSDAQHRHSGDTVTELPVNARRSVSSHDVALRDIWYLVMPSRALKPGKLLAQRILNESLVFGRDRSGNPFAMHNACRHQAMPLSLGRFDGERLECPNHGWLYDTLGRCVGIPCLSATEKHDTSRIKVITYPCRDVQGNIWIFMGEQSDDMPEPPRLNGVEAEHLRVTGAMTFPCGIDRAALGLIDPAHGPYVHKSWFRQGEKSRREKEKRFVPSELGFTMARHSVSSSQSLWLLPKHMNIEIRFLLPGVHFETIEAGKHVLAGMITATPVTPTETLINYNAYWTLPWIAPAQPIIAAFLHHFFDQDRRAMAGLAGVANEKAPMVLVGGPDVQGIWYFKLKNEFLQAKSEGRPFRNPVEETVLRWRT